MRETQRTSKNNPSLEYEDFTCHNNIESLNRWGDDKKIRWEEILYFNTFVFSCKTFVTQRNFWCFPLRSTAQHSGSALFAFPLQFSTALEWAGLYTSPHQALAGSAPPDKAYQREERLYFLHRPRNSHFLVVKKGVLIQNSCVALRLILRWLLI